VVAALMWGGGQNLYTALTNRKPTVISYEEYEKGRPKAAWLVLTNCQLNVASAAYLYKYVDDKNPTELYIPLQSQGAERRKSCALLQTSDPALLASFKTIQGLTSDAKLLEWFMKHPQEAFPRRTVQGTVRFGIDMKDSTRRQLAKIPNLVEDFVVLKENEQPSMAVGLICTTAGVALLVFGIRRVIGSRTQ
jgi:hypothetical protein